MATDTNKGGRKKTNLLKPNVPIQYQPYINVVKQKKRDSQNKYREKKPEVKKREVINWVNRYNTNEEFREKMKARNKEAYHARSAINAVKYLFRNPDNLREYL